MIEMKYKITYKAQDFGLTNMMNKAEDTDSITAYQVAKWMKDNFNMRPAQTGGSGKLIFHFEGFADTIFPRREIEIDLENKTFKRIMRWSSRDSDEEMGTREEIGLFKTIGFVDSHPKSTRYHTDLSEIDEFFNSKGYVAHHESRVGSWILPVPVTGKTYLFYVDFVDNEVEKWLGIYHVGKASFEPVEMIKLTQEELNFFDIRDFDLSRGNKDLGQEITDWF